MADKIKVEVDESLESFIPGYLEDIGKWVEAILKAFENNDFETIRQLSHKMAGTGAGYGFEFITRAGRNINKAAHGKESAPVKEWTGKLKDYLNRVEVIYVEDDDEFED